MKGHWAFEHGRQGKSDVDWHPVPLQTLFRGNLLRYFIQPKNDNKSDLEVQGGGLATTDLPEI